MKKKSLHRVNWSSHSAWGDSRYQEASKENQKESPGRTKNNKAGSLGKAGLIAATLAENKDPANASLNKVLHPSARPGRSRGKFFRR